MKKPIFIRRKIDTKIQQYLKLPEILAIVGPRQAGKTTYLQNLIKEKEGLFLTFEDIDVLNLFNTNIKEFAKIYIEKHKLICIDEFQYAKQGGKQLKYLFDTYKGKKIIVSGSSAIDMTVHAIKYLVGRVIVVNFWPLDIDELKSVFVKFKGSELYDYYSTFGGYPRVAIAESDEERRLILKNIYNTYFLREVKDVLGIVDESIIQKILIHLAQSVGSQNNYANIANDCGVSERDVKKYLDFMSKTFITHIVRPYHNNKITEIVKQPKIYFYDNGFLNHILGFRENKGKILEQSIVMESIKRNFDIKYWRDKSGNEMDFILSIDSNVFCAIEAKSGNKTGRSFAVFKSRYPGIRIVILDKSNYLEFYNK